MSALVLLEEDEISATLTLNRPERHNSLVPDLIGALDDALTSIQKRKDLRHVLLKANGSSFSTGGDVRAFWEAEDRKVYAAGLIGALNDVILKLMALPCPVIASIHGPITGGSLGLMLASDLVVITERTFLQPFYSVVGFAPDGGWTAILPDRIGTHQAGRILGLNERLNADQLLAMGLADALNNSPDEQVDIWQSALSSKNSGSIAASKRLLNDHKLEQYRIGLEREQQAFVDRINKPEVTEGMRSFLGLDKK